MSIYINLIILELNAILRLLIKDDIERYFVVNGLALGEHSVVFHLLPGWSLNWIVLHCFVEEVKGDKRDLNVCRPVPSSLLQFVHQR